MIRNYFSALLNKLFRFSSGIIRLVLTLTLIMLIGIVTAYYYLSNNLPDVEQLNTIRLQAPLRVMSADNQLIAEFGTKKRIPVEYSEIPPQLVQAVIATEDQRFFEHGGVDFMGLLRAAKSVLISGHKKEGGSTITMQVARNFFLTPEKTYIRKLREIILALRINDELSKEKILELYLNKIYLGNRAYGVASAAQVYYGKSLSELTLPQMAMLAGLPKAPSSLNPIANPTAAKERRDHVLGRMLDQGYISKAAYAQAVAAPLTAKIHHTPIDVYAPYIAEMVRASLFDQMGEDAYTSGYTVFTTVDSKDQLAANRAMREGLLAYTKRHGYRGALDNLGFYNPTLKANWLKRLKTYPEYNGLIAAAVTQVAAKTFTVLLPDGETATVDWADMAWARPYTGRRWPGQKPRKAGDIVSVGDIIRVTKTESGHWALSQLPEASGALVALNPETGGLLALVGGFSFQESAFNRAIQADRQPGSSFKPFIYSAALNHGYTLATIVNDAPIVLSNPGAHDFWRPRNDSRRFYGPTRLRVGLMKSRNLITIRILEDMGIDYAIRYLERFGFEADKMTRGLALALGTGSVTPLQMAVGFSVFANGGYRITPYFIDHIEDIEGRTLMVNHAPLACPTADGENTCATDIRYAGKALAPQVISPQNAYLMTSALQSVIQGGTGRAAKRLGRDDLGGKTGTTNDKLDAWFVGFNRDVVTSVWVGFDEPRTLYEYGSQAALPIWMDFMGAALKDKPSNTLAMPSGMASVRINAKTGLRTDRSENSVFETFRDGYLPAWEDKNAELGYGNEGEEAAHPLF